MDCPKQQWKPQIYSANQDRRSAKKNGKKRRILRFLRGLRGPTSLPGASLTPRYSLASGPISGSAWLQPITNPAIEARGEKHRCSLGVLNTENQRISESGGIPKKAHHIEYNWLEFLRPFWKPASGYPAKELKDYTGNLLPIPVKRLTPMIGPTSPMVTALANTPLCLMQNLAPKWRV